MNHLQEKPYSGFWKKLGTFLGCLGCLGILTIILLLAGLLLGIIKDGASLF